MKKRIVLTFAVAAIMFATTAVPAMAMGWVVDDLPAGSGVLVQQPPETTTPPPDTVNPPQPEGNSGSSVQGTPNAPTPPPDNGGRKETGNPGGNNNGGRTQLPKTGGDAMTYILTGLMMSGIGITGLAACGSRLKKEGR